MLAACDCEVRCVKVVEPMEHCVYFMARQDSEITLERCDTCRALTWHLNGSCLREKEGEYRE